MTTYDRLVFGMHHLNITQSGTGYTGKKSYSHPSYELDLAGQDTGVDYFRNKMQNTYFKVLGRFGNAGTYFFGTCDAHGNKKPVLCADGNLRVITLAMTHSWVNYTIGRIIKPGEVMYQEGTRGRATGNHIHLEVAEGWVTKKHRNSVGMYNVNGIMDARNVMWILDDFTTVVSTSGLTFRHCQDTTYEVPDVEYKMVNGYKVQLEDGSATFTTGPINVRDGTPDGAVVAQYNKGQTVNYWGKWVGNGHRYVVYTSYSGKIRFVAVNGKEDRSEPWATFKGLN